MVDFHSSSGMSSFGRLSAFLQGSSPHIEFAILNPAIVNQTSHSRRKALARNIDLCCCLFDIEAGRQLKAGDFPIFAQRTIATSLSVIGSRRRPDK
jgi:hypothetical protein